MNVAPDALGVCWVSGTVCVWGMPVGKRDVTRTLQSHEREGERERVRERERESEIE